MARPSAGAKGQWVELTNVTAKTIDLDGLVLRDKGTDFWPIPKGVVVPAGKSLVLGASTNPALNGNASVDVAWGFFSLEPDADAVVLEGAGIALDQVVYDVEKGWPLKDGHAMSLTIDKQTTSQNDLPGTWCLASAPFGAGDLGTPGEPNPFCEEVVGEVILTEVLADPVNMSDADGEWLEVYNPGDVGIDLSGWRLEGQDGEVAFLPPGLVVAPGDYLVLARSDDPSKLGTFEPDFVWDAFGLSNTFDTVRLVNAGGLVVDEVSWDATWPLEPGRSAELVPSHYDHLANDAPSSWCSSDAPDYGLGNHGTPGGPPVACQ
jgi:hypothetical protein